MTRYILCFGLAIALGKLCLEIAWHGFSTGLVALFPLYYGAGALAALPLWFYRQARQRHGERMDRVMLGCTGLAVLFGVLHDQAALRVSTEYFTIGHFPIAGIASPTLLAALWGFLGTWWLGAGLGMLLALVAYGGEKPVFPVGLPLLKNGLVYLLGLEVFSWLMGWLGYMLAQAGLFPLPGEYAQLVPTARQPLFMADWWANGTAYLGVLAGMAGLSRHIVKARSQAGAMVEVLKG
jgi:hypothetical protein